MPVKKLAHYFPADKVEPIRHLLHSITAESSFLIRTFFFILFGGVKSLDQMASVPGLPPAIQELVELLGRVFR